MILKFSPYDPLAGVFWSGLRPSHGQLIYEYYDKDKYDNLEDDHDSDNDDKGYKHLKQLRQC